MTKISDLTAITALVGTEEFVVAKSGTTRKIAASDLAVSLDGVDAANVDITDGGSYYTATDVEGALQELGPSVGGGGGDWALIGFSELGSDASALDSNTILGGNISGAYRHLVLVGQIRSTKSATSDRYLMRFNNDSGSNYDLEFVNWAGGSGAATNNSGQTSFNYLGDCPAASSPTGANIAFHIWIPNYVGTTFRKGFTSDSGGCIVDDSADIRRQVACGQWRSTSALTRVSLFFAADNVKAGSCMSIYGLG